MPSAQAPGPSRSTRSLRAITVSLGALLLYALLIDAAVETYLSASDLRLYVAIPVALYVSFTVWLLRQHRANRPGAESSVWLSAFLLLGILAATSTMPGGLDAGMRVATLPTTTVLTLASILVIGLAVITLVVDSPLPVWSRVIAGLAAAYALTAFVLGLVQRTSYVRLMQGASWWTRLPNWAQGAFVGAVLLVPLAFAIEIGVALARVKVRGRVYRIVGFALGFVIAHSALTATIPVGH